MELLTADGVFAALEAVTPRPRSAARPRRDDGGLAAVAAAARASRAAGQPRRGRRRATGASCSRAARRTRSLAQLLLAFKVAAAERRAPDDGDDANDDYRRDGRRSARQGLLHAGAANRMEDAARRAAPHCDANNAGPRSSSASPRAATDKAAR